MSQRRGFILPAALAVTMLMILVGGFLYSFVLAEQRIAASQSESVIAYYIAEAGGREAIWKLEHDAAWQSAFETDPTWIGELTRESALFAGGSYSVRVENDGLAQGNITVTGTFRRGTGSTSQRVIQTRVFKAIGESPIGDNAIATGSNKIDFTASVVQVNPGSLMSNNNILVQTFSDVDVQNEASATNNITISGSSTLDAGGGLHDAVTYPPPPAPIAFPAVDFDSSNPQSLKMRAENVYTQAQFETLLWNNPNLTLNGITYVTGPIAIKGDTHLTVNGALVSDDTIDIGTNLCWFRSAHVSRCGNSSVDVNHTVDEPSGLYSKKKINLDLFTSAFTVDGVVYALNDIKFTSLTPSVSIRGSLLGQKFTTVSIWTPLLLAFDSEIVFSGLGVSAFAPTVTIEHWEEEY